MNMDNEEDKDMGKSLLAEYEMEFSRLVVETRETESKILDSATALRVYGDCFLSRDPVTHTAPEVEARLFPWWGTLMPEYTRWDGETIQMVSNIAELSGGPSRHSARCYWWILAQCP